MRRPARAPGFELLSIDTPAGGANHTSWGTARVHVKANSAEHPMLVVNELICSRLASALGLPVPPGEVFQAPDGTRAWVSAQILLQEQRAAPPDPADIVADDAELAAGVVVFDSWIHNLDRNDDNLIYHPRLGLWLIDHEQALGGHDPGLTLLQVARGWKINCGVFQPEQIDQQLAKRWIGRVGQLPLSIVTRILKDARRRGLLDEAQMIKIRDFLSHRQQTLETLVRQCLGWGNSPQTPHVTPLTEGEPPC